MNEIVNINEIQYVLGDILKYFKTVCEENNLNFILSNGTMLGAVKYNGFIPWDDDADVFMPREDYDVLQKVLSNQNSHYKLISRETEPCCKLTYSKLIDTRTLLVESNADFGVELGLFLDIFPIDNWHSNRRIAKLQAVYSELLKRLMVAANIQRFDAKGSFIKKFILFIIWKAGQIIGYEKTRMLNDKLVKSNRKMQSAYKGNVVWTCYSSKEVIPADVFEKTIMVNFGKEKYPVPAEYDTYLSSLYGDWRRELPVDKQKSNHKIKAWWKDE